MREAKIIRKTTETNISLNLNIEGTGKAEIDSGCGFLNHMLTLFAKHGRFDIELKCDGDTEVDYHHSVEDIGIALGEAFCEALGDKRGIVRYGDIILPMDESLILAAVDLSGRSFLGFSLEIPTEKVGDFDTELLRRIDECRDFILILSEGALDRCVDPSAVASADWVRCELAYALEKNKNIVPIMLAGFTAFPDNLPDDIRKVVRKNGPKYDSYYFDDFYRRLKSDFLETKPEERGDEDAYVTQLLKRLYALKSVK